MTFRLEPFLEDFDGSNPGTPANSHKFVVTASSTERILWARVSSVSNQVMGSNDFCHAWFPPSSLSLDSSSRIQEVEFVLPAGSGEHGVNVMYYTI